MSEPTPANVDVSDVIRELCASPLGQALFEKAQLAVLVAAQETELRYLRSLQAGEEA